MQNALFFALPLEMLRRAWKCSWEFFNQSWGGKIKNGLIGTGTTFLFIFWMIWFGMIIFQGLELISAVELWGTSPVQWVDASHATPDYLEHIRWQSINDFADGLIR